MIIRNATILDLQELSRFGPVDLRIADGRIVEVGSDRIAGGDAAGDEPPIDATGLYLIPGLVNVHAHTAMTLLRGAAEDVRAERWFNEFVWIYERNIRPEDVYLGTLLGAAEMLRSGVTCVADHYFHMDQAWRAYRQAGMRADLSWAAFGVGEGWQEEFQRTLRFVEEYRDRDPRISVSLGPHSPYICPPKFLREIAELAGRESLKMHIHVSETAEQVERSLAESGKTPVEVLHQAGVLRPGTILAHAYHATDSDLERIRDSAAGVAHCAKTYLKFGDVEDFLPRALAAGVAVGLGSDGPCSNNSLSIFETARDAAFIAKSARNDAEAAAIGQVLPLVHRGGQILGLEGYGRIREGSPADLLLIDPAAANLQPEHNVFANLLYSLQERNIDTVIVDGRVVVRRGELLTVDLEELFARCGEAAGGITRREPGDPLQRY